MVKNCCIYTCRSRAAKNHAKKSYFRVPVEASTRTRWKNPRREWLERRRALWLSRIFGNALPSPQSPNTVSKNLWVCEDHFLQGRPSAVHEINHPDWAPSQHIVSRQISMDAVGAMENRQFSTAASNETKEACQTAVTEDHDYLGPRVTQGDSNPPDEEEDDSEHIDIVEDQRVTDSNCFSVCGSETVGTQTLSYKRDVGIQTIKKMRSVSVQTDITSLDMDKHDKSIASLEKKVSCLELREEFFKGNDDAVLFYTGLPSYKILLLIFNFVCDYISVTNRSSLTKFQQFLLTMMKLRLNLYFKDLAYRFCVSEQTASRIFNSTVGILYSRLKRGVFWPDREVLRSNMPLTFEKAFGKSVSVIINCFEIFFERASNLKALGETFSNYKHQQTLKYLIGITPQGFICYISEGFEGKASDKFATAKSTFLEHLEPGDHILADRGFLIDDMVSSCYAKVIIPGFKKDLQQISPSEVERTRKIANVSVHVERVIGSLRQKYTILGSTIPISLLTNDHVFFDEIVHLCCCLVNFCESVVPML
ncbi:uncharacterized protein LOC113217424 [Frankliniella occidentalis]|uniref:Uncharacterized protein LOC113217424 n=1 Tax=Frankliniella occidentalis TaxID=133901 RepID=A0A6J1TQW3_FRAOC|nr:uncharacterized protein LOC113217424 [Frankliniella occidentalis]